jgi:hypothetical protein
MQLIEELSLVILPYNEACLRFVIDRDHDHYYHDVDVFEQLMEQLLVAILSTEV